MTRTNECSVVLNNIKEVIMLSARERLNSLRNLTQQLKTSTKKGPLDFSRLRQLVETAKQYRTSPSQLPPSPDKGLQTEDVISSEQFRPLFPSSKREFPPVSNQAQILQLREQNLALEEQIVKLKEQLNSLQINKELKDNRQQEKSNFFKISERLQCFIGRLQLKGQAYSGFQYSEYQVEVSLDKIVFVRRQKGTVEQFELSCLKGGQYPSDNILVLRFQEFQGHLPCSIFMRFLSEQHLHKWDLALYSNYQIVTSLSQTKLFQRYFRGVGLEMQARKEKQKIKALRQSTKLDQQGDKDLLSLLIQKRQQYIEMKNLFSTRLDSKIKANLSVSKEEAQMGQYSLNQEKNSHFQFQSPKEKIIQKEEIKTNKNEDKIVFQEKNISQKIDQPLSISKKDSKQSFIKLNNISPIDRISELEPIIQQSQRNQNRQSMQVSGIQGSLTPYDSYTKPIIMQGLGSKVSMGSIKDRNPVGWQGNGSMRQSKASLVHQLNNIQGRNSSFQSVRNQSASKLREIALQKYNTAKIRLQKGYAATKYSKDGFSPHEKHVFLSLDCKKLCWSQKQKQSQYKSIPIAVISKAEYGIIGEGIAKHLKNPDSNRFCVIEYLTSDYKKKTIELGSNSAQDIKDIVTQLNIILQGKQALATTS